MAKGKKETSVQNRHLYSRASFLYQAAKYLTLSDAELNDSQNSRSDEATSSTSRNRNVLQGAARRMATDMRAVSLKTQMRLSSAVKQTVCKYCDSLLVEGESCTSIVENNSKGEKKPWADVLVRRCGTCGGEKRYPVNSPRQERRSRRAAAEQEGRSRRPVEETRNPEADACRSVERLRPTRQSLGCDEDG